MKIIEIREGRVSLNTLRGFVLEKMLQGKACPPAIYSVDSIKFSNLKMLPFLNVHMYTVT